LDDFDAVFDATMAQAVGPCLVLGHSMGGLVVAAALWRRSQRGAGLPTGLVLSSPALDVGMGLATRALVAVLDRWAPQLTLGNGLPAHRISHDPQVVRAYQNDPLVHDRIGAPLARFFHHWGQVVREEAVHWPVPTLLLYAQDDSLVRPSGSRAFADAAAQAGAPVQAQGFEALFHEIFNEPEAMAAPVWLRLQAWLQATGVAGDVSA
jgi:alpha-beta hydrolase superfamily lysophospholipase